MQSSKLRSFCNFIHMAARGPGISVTMLWLPLTPVVCVRCDDKDILLLKFAINLAQDEGVIGQQSVREVNLCDDSFVCDAMAVQLGSNDLWQYSCIIEHVGCEGMFVRAVGISYKNSWVRKRATMLSMALSLRCRRSRGRFPSWCVPIISAEFRRLEDRVLRLVDGEEDSSSVSSSSSVTGDDDVSSGVSTDVPFQWSEFVE